MRPFALVLPSFAMIALAGCGGNSGSQPTTLNRTLTIETGSAYASSTPVDTVDGKTVAPIALFATKDAQQVVLWGSRDETTGDVASVHEAVYSSPDVKPLYAKYNADGGLTSVKDSDSGSYVTFSALTGSSLVAAGYDAKTGKTGSIKATISDLGVQVEVIDDGSGKATKRQLVPFASLVKPRAISRAAGDPLAGLSSVAHDPDDRTKIITAIFRAASLVVKKPFDKIVSDVAGYLLLDQLGTSYTDYTAKGFLPSANSTGTTPLPYVADLP